MKRKAGWIGLLTLTLLLGWFWRPVAAQFKYAALSLAQTFTALQTFSGGFKRPTVLIKEVCASGCEFTTVTAAVAAITDATATKRYTVLIYPGNYDEQVTMKSYVSLVGTDKVGVRMRGINACTGQTVEFPPENTEMSVSNMTVGGCVPLSGQGASTARVVVYISNAIIGITDGSENGTKSQDCIRSGGSNRDWHMTGTVCRTYWDSIIIGVNSTYRGYGNQFENTIAAGETNSQTLWVAAGGGRQVYEYGSAAVITSNSSSAGNTQTGATTNSIGSGGTQPDGIVLSGVTMKIINTNTSATANGICFQVASIAANSNASWLRLLDTTCEITRADAASTITALKITSDADHATWTANWTGGHSILSGGSTRNDVDNADAALTPVLTGVASGGVFAGAGAVVAGDARVGAFTTRLQGRTGDLVAATCTDKEIALDTAGANKEICICDGGAWACVTVTTATGPTN